MELATQDYSDRAAEPIREFHLRTCNTEQRQALTFVRQKTDCIIAEYMRRAALLKQADETQRKFFLHGVKMGEKSPAIDLMNIHGQPRQSQYNINNLNRHSARRTNQLSGIMG
jgi:hypothetical protein